VTETNGSGSCAASHVYPAAGVYSVQVTVTDDDGGSASKTYEFVVIYDPSAGFVTGGGWINTLPGSYVPDVTLSGKATFGFVSKYKKGATAPTGQTEFQFHVAKFNFHSEVYQWLVVSGAKAQYKGTGTVNGAGDYGFLLTATDGQVSGGGGVDKFRIKIWDVATSAIVYDNKMGASDDIDAADPQAIASGSIVVHK
jgi:PKD repeat protein